MEVILVNGATSVDSGRQEGLAGKVMSISVFARRSMLSVKALRLYERMGLLSPAVVDPANRYRFYHEDQLATARLIVMLRRIDMPLAQVREVVLADDADAAAMLSVYWKGVENRLAGQRELATYLRHRFSREGVPTMFDIKVRDVPDQLVLTELRHVTIVNLPGMLSDVSSRLIGQALELGGLTGHLYVIYHGVLDEDHTGPVEVCVPIHPAQDVPEGIPSRFEPAHCEAYAVLRKAQFEYPHILAAYDAVAQWSTEHTGGLAGRPREVYYPGFPAADADEEAAEIAYPVYPDRVAAQGGLSKSASS
jgi:DNA-binding transcriptional MerR regulator